MGDISDIFSENHRKLTELRQGFQSTSPLEQTVGPIEKRRKDLLEQTYMLQKKELYSEDALQTDILRRVKISKNDDFGFGYVKASMQVENDESAAAIKTILESNTRAADTYLFQYDSDTKTVNIDLMLHGLASSSDAARRMTEIKSYISMEGLAEGHIVMGATIFADRIDPKSLKRSNQVSNAVANIMGTAEFALEKAKDYSARHDVSSQMFYRLDMDQN